MIAESCLSPTQAKRLRVIAIISALVLALGAIITPGSIWSDATGRIWSNLLVAAFYLITIGLGGVLFIALTCVTGGKWQIAFRSIPQTMAKLLPLAGFFMLLVLVIRMNQYGWPHGGEHFSETFWFKDFWLTPAFWVGRSFCYIVLWMVMGHLLGSDSQGEHSKSSTPNTGIAVIFLAIYAFSFSLASADWIMALDPMWFSTIWGVYHFAGMMQATLAVIVILGLLLRMPGRALEGKFTDDHLHDLGKLLLGFSCFWMYIWFSQYMLIWYSNIPEETSHFMIRTNGPWGPIMVISIVLNWVVPFFVLLPMPAKRSSTVMMRVACVVLIGRWVDLYQMVFPSAEVSSPIFGIWELASVALLISLAILLLMNYSAGSKAGNEQV